MAVRMDLKGLLEALLALAPPPACQALARRAVGFEHAFVESQELGKILARLAIDAVLVVSKSAGGPVHAELWQMTQHARVASLTRIARFLKGETESEKQGPPRKLLALAGALW